MKITEEQRQHLYAAAKPLIEWMGKNCHPHCTAHVDLGGKAALETRDLFAATIKKLTAERDSLCERLSVYEHADAATMKTCFSCGAKAVAVVAVCEKHFNAADADFPGREEDFGD